MKAVNKNLGHKKKTVVVIKTTKGYAGYLSKHLQKEHPTTKGKITIRHAEQEWWPGNLDPFARERFERKRIPGRVYY